MRNRTFVIETLGCKVNQHESQGIREMLEALGLRETANGEPADVAVVNTCTVTGRADHKARQHARRVVRANPGAVVIVTGCAAAVHAEDLRRIPGVAHVLTKDQMPSLGAVLAGGEPVSGDVFDLRIRRFSGHVRAFLKVQDGCDARCSYCIVPMARGPSRSRPLAAVLDEARRLVDHGHREVVLTGVHLGRYGLDLGLRLADAVRAVLRTPGLERLRLSSIEALEVTPELLSVFGEDARLCPHLHLPMQSGDDAVLRAMNRGYTIRAFLDVVEEARRRLARPALTTDLMVGFPGETEAQFQNSLRACGEAGFSRVHVFRFSPRPGTPAAAMPGQVRPEAAADREARCLDIARDLALRYKLAFLGQVVEPLVETTRDRETGRLTGMTERYVSVRFAGPDALMNRIARVRISGATPETIEGEHVND